MALKDPYGRSIEYLRASVTEACNLRCAYCWSPVAQAGAGETLTRAEILQILRCAVSLGLVRIRLTGGEPLMRKDIVSLVQGISAIPGLQSLSLTTNGIFLEEKAEALRRAGLQRINISLDTLQADKYERLTGGGRIGAVLAGLRVALAAGFDLVKLNVVVLRGFNEEEVLDFVRLAENHPFSVRFIELMPFGCSRAEYEFVPAGEVRERIDKVYPLLPYGENHRNGPSRDYYVPGFRGTVGFIAPLSEGFCGCCNRLRLTARGRLRPCLDSEVEVDLVPALRSGLVEEGLKGLFKKAISTKPERHCGFASSKLGEMNRIGG